VYWRQFSEIAEKGVPRVAAPEGLDRGARDDDEKRLFVGNDR
jgi:hypothetical protein